MNKSFFILHSLIFFFFYDFNFLSDFYLRILFALFCFRDSRKNGARRLVTMEREVSFLKDKLQERTGSY